MWYWIKSVKPYMNPITMMNVLVFVRKTFVNKESHDE